jgi:hypothetical protein
VLDHRRDGERMQSLHDEGAQAAHQHGRLSM